MKTIFLALPFGMSARNYLRSELFTLLRQNAKVVILTPFSNNADFRKEFLRDNVVLEPLKFKQTLLGRIIRRFLEPVEANLFTEKSGIGTLRIFKDWLRDEDPHFILKVELMTKLLGWQPLLGLLRALNLAGLRHPEVNALFEKHKPDLVFIGHIMSLDVLQVAAHARGRGIKVAAMPHSWDNLTSKCGLRLGATKHMGRPIPMKFDKVVAWNQVLREEFKEHFGYDDADIFVSGVPQFDKYAHKEKFPAREVYFKKVGADPNKALILYAAGTPQFMPRQDEAVEIMIETIRSGKLKKPCQILVRHHPNPWSIASLSHIEKKYAGSKDVIFHAPSSSYSASSEVEWNAGEGDDWELPASLLHSNVVLTMPSTIILDAVAWDTPVVNICFDGRTNEPYLHSLRKTLDYTHCKKLADTGGFRTAFEPQELAERINLYLEHPETDAKERAEIRRRYCGDLDGGAGKRIAEFLLKVAG